MDTKKDIDTAETKVTRRDFLLLLTLVTESHCQNTFEFCKCAGASWDGKK